MKTGSFELVALSFILWQIAAKRQDGRVFVPKKVRTDASVGSNMTTLVCSYLSSVSKQAGPPRYLYPHQLKGTRPYALTYARRKRG